MGRPPPERALRPNDACRDPSDNASSAASVAFRRRSPRSSSSPSSAPPPSSSPSAFSGSASSASRTTGPRGSGRSRNELSPTASSRATRAIRLLLSENPGPGFYEVNPEIVPIGRDRSDVAIDQAVGNALVRLRPATRQTVWASSRPPEDRDDLRDIRAKSQRLAAVVGSGHRPVDRRCVGRKPAVAPHHGTPARHRPQPDRCRPREHDDGGDRGFDRAERELVRELSATCSSVRCRERSCSRCSWGSCSRGR